MKNNIRRVFIRPEGEGNFREQLNSCIGQVQKNHNSVETEETILQFSFFINATSNKDFIVLRNEIMQSLNKNFKDIPSYSVIAQPPADNLMVSVELTMIEDKDSDTRVLFKNFHETPYTVVNSSQGKEVYAAGICAKNPDSSLKSQVEESYKLMDEILTAEALSFSDIVRQWNYVENIVQVDQVENKPVQNYQLLNDTRSVYYAQSDFKNGYPAATGIGMNYGGILLEFYAVKPLKKVNIIPIKNPKQVDAYHYSQEVLVGDSIRKLQQKATPKFERAKYISLNGHKIVFISGTASIHNEKTIGINNIEEQTLVTIDNISNLVSGNNIENSVTTEITGTLKYSFLRIYIKDSSDLAVVKDICSKQFKDIPISYLIADICRDDLLIEIEGVAELL